MGKEGGGGKEERGSEDGGGRDWEIGEEVVGLGGGKNVEITLGGSLNDNEDFEGGGGFKNIFSSDADI